MGNMRLGDCGRGGEVEVNAGDEEDEVGSKRYDNEVAYGNQTNANIVRPPFAFLLESLPPLDTHSARDRPSTAFRLYMA